jgi:predicted acetyltransferase
MTERGFAAGHHSVAVHLTDPWSDGVGGAWRLECADGTGTATPTTEGEAALTADVGALSALTIGGFTAGDLLGSGRLQGDPAAIATLAAMFATPAPRISDDF